MNQAHWDNHLRSLRSYKRVTDQQRLLLELTDKPDRSKDEQNMLNVLVKAEQARVQAAADQAEASRLLQARDKAAQLAARKARAHRLIKQGSLHDLVGLHGRPPAAIVGLLAAAGAASDEHWQQWEVEGSAIMQARANEHKEILHSLED